MSEITQENAYDYLTEQIFKCHIEACNLMLGIPQLQTVITLPTWNAVLRNTEIYHHLDMCKSDPCGSDGAEFRGSKIIIVPGRDLFCHTRCINLP